MANREPRSIKGHHISFGAASVLMLLTTVWAFYDDYYDREYMGYQKEYLELEVDRVAGELKDIERELLNLHESPDKYLEGYELEQKFIQARKDYEKNQGKLKDARARVRAINDALSLKRRQLNFAATDVDVYKWDWLDADEDEKKDKYDDLIKQEELRRKLFNEVNRLEGELAEANAKIEAIEEPVKNAEKVLAAYDAKLLELERGKAKLEGIPAINFLRDAPGLDFVDPRWNINDQIVLAHLPLDVRFAMTPRVDRCVACHKGIANPDPKYRSLDGEQKVFRSHPRLDLYVSANSPHPMKQFGCTICHQGRGPGLSFLRSGHTPRNPEQGEKWRETYGWDTLDHHKPGQPLWDAPMLPMQYVEASCMKCHKGVDSVPEAPKLNQGRELFREKGCANCHMGTSDPDMAWVGRIGPDLRRIGEKTDPDWTRRWIENPWAFRPTTTMPRVFGLENRHANLDRGQLQDIVFGDGPVADTGEQLHPRDPVEIEAITTYLFAASKLRERKLDAPQNGNPEKGKTLFENVGCLGCHSTAEAAVKFTYNEHGPDLSRIGEKVKESWLFDWLKNPKHYWAETRMPSLRLSDQEAADLTAYIAATLRKTQTPQAWKAAPHWANDSLVYQVLKNSVPDFKIRSLLENADSLVRNELKKKVKYATLPGQTEKKDTGAGEWTEEQIDAVMAALDAMGETDADRLNLKKSFFAGQALIQHYGCYSCHNIQGWTYAPLSCVNLQGEGDKDVTKFDFGLQPIPTTRWDWIYLKLARPRAFDEGKLAITRPLDRLRMPWFGLKKETLPEAHPHDAVEPAGHAGHAAGGHGASKSVLEVAARNPDLDTMTQGAGLSHEEIEALVTVVLSYTNEPIPLDMKKLPSADEQAIDHGKRVVKALNCTGCHLIGMDKPITHLDFKSGHVREELRGKLRLDALLLREAQTAAKNQGYYSDTDYVSIDEGEAKAFLSFGQGTYLTENTLPVLLGERKVRRSPLEPEERLKFRIERRQPRENAERWVPYGQLMGGIVDYPVDGQRVRLVNGLIEAEIDGMHLQERREGEKSVFFRTVHGHEMPAPDFERAGEVLREHRGRRRFRELTWLLFKDDLEGATAAYDKYAERFVNVDTYERIAGTEALSHVGWVPNAEGKLVRPFYVSPYDVQQRTQEGTAWPPLYVNIRTTQGEGNIVPHIMKVEQKQQQAPPSLAFQGGKVQPDWLYKFIRHPYTLRPGMNIRMPSFWDRASVPYKEVYPAGHLSALKLDRRPTGVAGEPEPLVPIEVDDDAMQLVRYFQADGGERDYGFQPIPELTEESKKQYLNGYHLLFPADPQKNPEGVSCTSCHAIGNFAIPAEKGPNLRHVKRRFKEKWLRRFLAYPQGIYPWADMPSNFYDWGAYDPEAKLFGMVGGDEERFKVTSGKVNDIVLYLMLSGEQEVGTLPPPVEQK